MCQCVCLCVVSVGCFALLCTCIICVVINRANSLQGREGLPTVCVMACVCVSEKENDPGLKQTILVIQKIYSADKLLKKTALSVIRGI